MRLSALTFFCCFAFLAQGQMAIDLTALDSIKVAMNQNTEPVYWHKINKGETVYSIAKFFQVNHNDLLIINGLKPNEIISPNTNIQVPINKDVLLKSAYTPDFKCIPVYYKVKKQETLFKIAQVYFDQSIEALIKRNGLNKLSLDIDQVLLVGWWPVNKAPSPQNTITESLDTLISSENTKPNPVLEQSVITSDSLSQIDTLMTSETDTISLESPVIISNRGIAVWERQDPNTETMIVLHRTAKVGSQIKLQNPVTELITVAQVVGHIPQNVYTDDIDIIISKAVAQKLGALDTRFQIIMTFYE